MVLFSFLKHINLNSISKVHYRTTNHFIFIYDVTKHDSFDNIKSIYQKIKQYVKKSISFILIGLILGKCSISIVKLSFLFYALKNKMLLI